MNAGLDAPRHSGLEPWSRHMGAADSDTQAVPCRELCCVRGDYMARAESASNQNSVAAACVAIFFQHMLALVHSMHKQQHHRGGG
jgi:hypothetical protein